MSRDSQQQAAPDEGAASPRQRVLDTHVALVGYPNDPDPECECGWDPEFGVDGWVAHRQHVNDELLAAGVAPNRPEGLCMIRTVDQLDALPTDAVVRDAIGDVLRKGFGANEWWIPGSDELFHDRHVRLPALLLWHPDWSE